MPVPTPISPTVGPAEGVSVFGGQGAGLQRSGCRFGAAYAITGVSFYSIDYNLFHIVYDTGMIRATILRSEIPLIIPVKE